MSFKKPSLISSLFDKTDIYLNWFFFRNIYVATITLQLFLERNFLFRMNQKLEIRAYSHNMQIILLILFMGCALYVILGKYKWIGTLFLALLYYLIRFPQSLYFGYHYDAPPVFVLLIIAFSEFELRNHNKFSINSTYPFWPSQLVRLYLGSIYFLAAIAKLQNSGIAWFTGESLRSSLITRSLFLNSSLPMVIADNEVLCIISSWLSFFFEFFFITVVIFPQYSLAYLFAGMIFHGIIMMTMGLDFSFFFAPTFLSLVPYSSLIPMPYREALDRLFLIQKMK